MPNIPTATTPDQRKPRIPALLAVTISVAFLIFIWHRNYNLLGSFYDYSILTSAVGYLHAGLHPYHDFTTPLQSLTIYLCDAAELIFGQRYLALAYANLLAGLLGFFLLLRLLKTALPFPLRLLVATAFTVSTFFQHGILWYDSVAMLLLTLTCLVAANVVHHPKIRRRDIFKLCLLLFLSSTNKLNFHALGLAFVFLAAAAHYVLHPSRIKTALLPLALLAIAGSMPGPIFEMMINHSTPSEYIENVFRTPAGRGASLIHLFDPNLYLGKLWDFYPDSWISGIFLLGFLIYAGCLRVAFRPLPESEDKRPFSGVFIKLCSLIIFSLFFLAALLLTATNLDTEILTSVFLVIGLALAFVLLGKRLSASQNLVFRFALTVLAGLFLVAGSASAFMHSRVRYWEPSWTAATLDAIRTQHSFSAMKNAVPFFPAETISPVFNPYFSGVRFTEPAQKKLNLVTAFMKRFPDGETPDIYWGPGLEILTRVYHTPRRGRLPLWYHVGVSVRERDSAAIISELERVHYEWIVTTTLISDMPAQVREYIQKSYDCIEDDDILVYRRLH